MFDPAPERREAAARLVPGARFYAHLEELLAAERALDALIVCSPPKFHAEAVLAGLRAGLHVLCEKPLTLDPAVFATLRAEAARRDRCVYTVDNWTYAPALARLLDITTSGRLGRLRRAELRVTRTKPSASAVPGDWRKDLAIAGGGILVDHGWHNLYLLRSLLGPGLELDSAQLLPEGAIDEVVDVHFHAPGAVGAIHLSWRAKERANFISVEGDRGTADLNDDVLVVKTGGRTQTERFPQKLSAGSAHPDWLAAMWSAFRVECAGRGRGESLAAAEFCLRAIHAAYRSKETARA